MSRDYEVILLHTNGTYETKCVARKRGYETLRALIGGYLEHVPHIKPDMTAYCDEEGRLKRLAPNPWARFMRTLGYMVSCPLVGNVVLCQTNRSGNDVSVSETTKRAVERHYHECLEQNTGSEESERECDSDGDEDSM